MTAAARAVAGANERDALPPSTKRLCVLGMLFDTFFRLLGKDRALQNLSQQTRNPAQTTFEQKIVQAFLAAGSRSYQHN